MYEIISKNNNLSAVYKININKNKYIGFLTSNINYITNSSFFFNLLRVWVLKYIKVISFLGFNLNFFIFLFFQDKFVRFRSFTNDLTHLKFILILTFRSMHLRVNYYDLCSYVFQYYSIGMLLNMFKLESKSYRRSLKGVKVLINFLGKKISKKYFKSLALIKVNGLTKNYLKFFYLLSNILLTLNVKIFLWNPIKSWNKNGVKKIKSIKRRIKKKLIKIEQKI